MILWLLGFLQSLGIKVPLVFMYFSTRMLLACATALLFTLCLGPKFIRKLYELKIGQPIRSGEECPLLHQLHEKKKDTPTMGGVLILSAMLLSLVLWMDLTNLFTLILCGTTLVLGGLGAVDDYLKLKYKNSKGLSARVKFGVQIGLSCIIAAYFLAPDHLSTSSKKSWFHAPVAKECVVSVQETKKGCSLKTFSLSEMMQRLYIPFFKKPLVFEGYWKWILFFFIIFVITGSSNAVNLTDGLDGLASGALVMVFFVLGIVSFLSNHLDLARYLNILYIEGSGEIGIYLFAAAGAALGFLWYNGYPAQIMMGDTGSLALGGILGVASVCLRREIFFGLAGMLFVLEALSVIIQVLSFRYRKRKRVFLCTPLHHHFEYKGWPETKIVMRFWILSLLFSMIAILSLKVQ